ncbi:MAG: hypothetical protein ACRCWS_00120, partial [Propionibacteriaceae bacterium]
SCPKMTLAVNESMTCTALTIYAPEQGVHTDTATVTAVGVGIPVTGTSQASAVVAPKTVPIPTPTPAPITVAENPEKRQEAPLADTGFGLGSGLLLLTAGSMVLGGVLLQHRR